MAYRAPELYDIHPGSKLDEKVDIWVGITIFLFFFKVGDDILICAHDRVSAVCYTLLRMDRVLLKPIPKKWVDPYHLPF